LQKTLISASILLLFCPPLFLNLPPSLISPILPYPTYLLLSTLVATLSLPPRSIPLSHLNCIFPANLIPSGQVRIVGEPGCAVRVVCLCVCDVRVCVMYACVRHCGVCDVRVREGRRRREQGRGVLEVSVFTFLGIEVSGRERVKQ
jgi:hypothetical protein